MQYLEQTRCSGLRRVLRANTTPSTSVQGSPRVPTRPRGAPGAPPGHLGSNRNTRSRSRSRASRRGARGGTFRRFRRFLRCRHETGGGVPVLESRRCVACGMTDIGLRAHGMCTTSAPRRRGDAPHGRPRVWNERRGGTSAHVSLGRVTPSGDKPHGSRRGLTTVCTQRAEH